jgi:hypothetical protein
MSVIEQSSAGAGLGDPFEMVLAGVREELGDLVDVPVWSLDDGALDARFDAAVAARAAVDEVLARMAAEMDDRGMAARRGASSTRAHLVASHRLSRAEASRVVAAARVVHGPTMVAEPVRRAQASGQVSREQAVTIAEAVDRLDPAIDPVRVEALQHDLIGHAATLSFEQLQQVANHAVEVVDPDGADAVLEEQLRRQEADARRGCEFVLSIHPDGSSHGRFRNLPAVATAMLKKALDAVNAPRRQPRSGEQAIGEAVGLDASALLVGTSRDQLPYPTRMGRAFSELLEHLPADGLPGHGTLAATIVVTLEEARLRQQCGEALLDTGTAISAAQTRRLACNAGIVPAVLGADSAVLDLGMTRRLFDRHQRLALAIRDRGCVFPGCDRPPAWCEAHHSTAWSEGGPTDLSNGCLLCSFHHHLVHLGEWQLVMAPDGIVDVIPPARIDPERHPIRHQRFRPRRT